MNRLAWTRVLIAAVASLTPLLGDLCAAGTDEVRLNGRSFLLREGFTIELAASPPLVDRPIVAAFDERGRLYVADSSGSNAPVARQLEEKPHRIVRLEDADGDGRFDRRTLFADRMMFPEGAMWFEGSLYVAAPPSLWKLTDSDGDGVADHRVEWFQGKTLTGCANDLHGPYCGPDGWIYWCKGAFATQSYERPGKPPLVTRAAHVFRSRPDGSGIEPVMTGGMDNPVDVVFTPGGERIVSATFLQHPGGGHRDGLIHAVYGGVYGKVHDAIDGHPRTSGDVMPVLTHLGPAAPCGLTRYESDVFGSEYRDNLFATLFNMQKVTRHVLEPKGATFTTHDEDFLVAAERDFHPTDVLEDADGSLIVIDTGGWYKLCCPTSQLGKPDVLGAIYRVRRKGPAKLDDPRGLNLEWGAMADPKLASLLDDPRPAVRHRAIEALAGRGKDALPAIAATIRGGRSAEIRRNAIWAASRVAHPDARALVRQAFDAEEETVCQAAIHVASVWRDREAVAGLLERARTHAPQTRRVVAEALGRIGDRAAVPVLLEMAGEASDRVLEHSITYALIEIADPKATAAGLPSPNLRTRRAAMIALDQMEGGRLAPEDVVPSLTSTDPPLKEAASWIVERHPEWAADLEGFLRERLAAKAMTASDRVELERQLARFARATPIQKLLTDRLRDSTTPPEALLTALRAMAQSGLKDVPEAWVSGLTRALASQGPALVRQAVVTARALPLAKVNGGPLASALLEVARDAGAPVEVRLDAIAAVPGGLAKVDPDILAFVRAELAPERPVAVRIAAADVLAKATLTAEQLTSLASTLETAGPLEVDRLLAAFGRSTDEKVGLSLIAALHHPRARSSLRMETLKPLLTKYPSEVRRQAEGLYATLDADKATQKARLVDLLASLSGGDVRRGQAVFNGPKAACASCHAIGYLGGRLGPDLTKIGQVRAEGDLLESILFPSASFVRSYEPFTVATRDGKVYNGVLRKDSAEEVVLATGANEEAHLVRSEIDEMRPGTVSVMPAGLDRQLTSQELADLVAFLKACR